MNIGQLVSQMSFGAGLETALPFQDESMNIEGQGLQASPFGDVLRDISSPDNVSVRIMQGRAKVQQVAGDVVAESNAGKGQQIGTQSTDMKLLSPPVSDGDTVDVFVPMVSEKLAEDTDNQQLITPQNVDISSFGLQFVPSLQVVGRMSEPQIADQKNMITRDVSISASHAAEAVPAVVTQCLPGLLPHHDAGARPSLPAQSGQQPEAAMVVSNAPVFEPTPASGYTVVVPVATPAASGENNDFRRSVMSAPPGLAASPVVAPEVHAHLTGSVMNAYGQTLSRSSAIQPTVVADGGTSQPTVPASTVATVATSTPATSTPATPAATPAVTCESTPVVTLGPLFSRLTPVAPVAAESSVPAISASVTQHVASVSRIADVQPVTVSPEAPLVVHPVPVQLEATNVVSNSSAPVTAPASRSAFVVPVASPAGSEENNDIRRSVTPASQNLAASPVLAPEVHADRTESVLNAYYQTSSRPSTVATHTNHSHEVAKGGTSQPTVTASALPATQSVTSESTPVVTTAPLVSRLTPVATIAAESSGPATPALVTQTVASVTRITELQAVTVTPASPSLAEPVLDVSSQTSSRPTTVSAPTPQRIAAADSSTSQPMVTATPSAPVVISEIAPAITLAPLADLRPLSETSPSAAAELLQSATPTSVTQQVSSVARGTVVPLRNPDNVVQDVSPLRQGSGGENRMSEQVATVTSGAVKAPSAFDTSGNMPGNGHDDLEQNLNGQAHLFVQPLKAGQPVLITTPVAGDLFDPFTKESMEHVVQQVKEHLAGRDYKAGVEQITIRLTPEHMGELKLNLRMENQQLKVEIVAENSMVRDVLLKHGDALKETLARQNITMESFDVTTGGRGSGSQGSNQNAWRELDKQQQQSWATPRGYHAGQVEISPVHMASQRQQGHSMLDIHY